MLVADLFEFDAKADIVPLKRKRSAGTTVNFVDEFLHLFWVFNSSSHVVVELVWVHDVRLRQEVMIVHELIGALSDHFGKQRKALGDVDATVNYLILAKFDRPIWCAWRTRKDSVLPS